MPRGVPRLGFRMTEKRKREMGITVENKAIHMPVLNKARVPGYDNNSIKKLLAKSAMTKPAVNDVPAVSEETDEEIDAKLKERFEILETMVQSAIEGDVRALIVSGPAGLGKSYTVEKKLLDWDPNEVNCTINKGYVKATGLYKQLFNHKEKGQVLVFDDADTIFFDDTSLNFLKAVCDTNDRRRVSYLAEGSLIDEETAQRLPKKFEFNGTIIFITNYDFDAMIARGHKLAPHLQALMSRSHYIDLAMRTKRDYFIRIKQVIEQGLLRDKGLTTDEENDVVKFIENNMERMRELSLRMALKIGAIRKSSPHKWQSVARVTCCRNV